MVRDTPDGGPQEKAQNLRASQPRAASSLYAAQTATIIFYIMLNVLGIYCIPLNTITMKDNEVFTLRHHCCEWQNASFSQRPPLIGIVFQ